VGTLQNNEFLDKINKIYCFYINLILPALFIRLVGNDFIVTKFLSLSINKIKPLN